MIAHDRTDRDDVPREESHRAFLAQFHLTCECLADELLVATDGAAFICARCAMPLVRRRAA